MIDDNNVYERSASLTLGLRARLWRAPTITGCSQVLVVAPIGYEALTAGIADDTARGEQFSEAGRTRGEDVTWEAVTERHADIDEQAMQGRRLRSLRS